MLLKKVKKKGSENKKQKKSEDMHRLTLIIGQLNGVKKMLEDDRPAADIVIQLQAARASVKIMESYFLRKHLRNAVESVFYDQEDPEQQIADFMKLFIRSDV